MIQPFPDGSPEELRTDFFSIRANDDDLGPFLVSLEHVLVHGQRTPDHLGSAVGLRPLAKPLKPRLHVIRHLQI